MLIALDIFVVLLIGLCLFWLDRLHPASHSVWRLMGVLFLFFFFADLALLAALPRVGLSFGAVDLPLFLITSARLIIFIPAFLLLARQPTSPQMTGLLIALIGLQVAVSIGEVDGLYIEPFRLGVTRLSIPAPAFFADRPLRILQISDLHVERISPRERAVIAQAKALQPDLIVLTGDYVNQDYMGDPRAWDEVRQVIAQLQAPYGVYAVRGTTDTDAIMAAVFDGLEVQVLEDRAATLHFPLADLHVLGVANLGRQRDKAALKALLSDDLSEGYTLLLYHTPDLIKTASVAGINLYLAGHTHGGQVRLPFYGAVFTFSSYGKKYEMGKYQVGDTTLYVSRGLGMEGWSMPRARFLCPPEIVLVDLAP